MKYNPAFDGLRAVAAVAVVAAHARLIPLSGGAIPVAAFFVLSGFLITSLLNVEITRTGGINLWRFCLHRASRLYPPLLLMLAGWSVFAVAKGIPDAGFQTIIVALYLSDYAAAVGALTWSLAHTWSLAVEEHFYLALPLALLAIASRPGEWRAAALAIAFAVTLSWRCVDLIIWRDPDWVYFRFDTAMAAPLFGAFLATQKWRPSRGIADIIGVSGAVVLVAIFTAFNRGDPVHILILYPLVIAAAGAVVLALTSEGSILWRVLSMPILARLGLLSYSIYLWHVLALAAAKGLPGAWRFLVALAISITVSWLSYAAIEKPLRDWRRARHSAENAGQTSSVT